ncbi:peptidase M23 [Nonlabens sp. MIC269]|uniref:peptidoglycan DD-metalloendopeptidase family protein n=1 Tax=Nonlabens sp. MIC269 TaxID=1476901 RepID=UPI000721B82F|nr:peptidoglycan DD-metalloendopeptidase family protein [Nonlabens sp. MIC269]ALM20955.1 peptidase M23 [Nonlabens sp. MIC269]
MKRHLLDPQLSQNGYFPLDLSINNPFWKRNDVADISVCHEYIEQQRKTHGAFLAIGGYLEQRALYQKNERFNKGIVRDIHLGVDIWAPAGTTVHAMYDGVVHSYAHNSDPGNYGPTLILQHDIEGQTIYTLYGHLSLDDVNKWEVGYRFRESEIIAHLGTPQENGGYSPHLHFQVMTDMKGYQGDFPGVAAKEELEQYKDIVLDPMSFLE